MSLIQARNLLAEESQKTRLTQAESAGTTTVRVDNSTGLTESWAVQIGETGGEQTEVVIGTPTNVGTIGVSTTNFAHPADTPLYFIKYDKVVFERSTAGTSGTASPMTSGTVTYQADNTYTSFDDTSGSSSYAYKTYFRNSVLSVNSTESDWITFAGPSFYSLAKIRERAKNKLWNASWLTDSLLDGWINEAKEMMINKVIQTNEDYALGTVDVAFGTDGLGTITTADFNQIRRVWVTYDGVNSYQSTKQNINDTIPNQIYNATHPYHAWRGDTVFQVFPSESQGTASLVFYRFGTPLVNDADELPQPMRPFSTVLVDYCYAQALGKDEKFTQSNNKMMMLDKQMDDFVTSLAPRDKSGITMIDIIDPIGPSHPAI